MQGVARRNCVLAAKARHVLGAVLLADGLAMAAIVLLCANARSLEARVLAIALYQRIPRCLGLNRGLTALSGS